MTTRTPEHEAKNSGAQSSDAASADHTDDASSDGFLSRWSRQKNRARPASDKLVSEDASDAGSAGHEQQNIDSDDLTVDAPDNASETDTSIVSNEEEDQEVLLTDADMPAVDTLNQSSDYSGFLNKGVSPELRKQALRHLFSHAIFNERDGLNDYDEDYTTFEPLGDTVTSDMRWHQARKEREEAERLAAEQEAANAQELEGRSPDSANDPVHDPDTDDVEQTNEEQPETDDRDLDDQQQRESDPVDSTDSPEFAEGGESTSTQNAHAASPSIDTDDADSLVDSTETR